MPLLHWLTREEDIHRVARAPYRLLEEAPELSYGEQDTGNMLIQGDNLDALKALLPYYAGKVKCIYIDPPYNTKSAFEHYDDNLEHSQWLALIYPRLELLRSLLSEDGSIWVSIDDNEGQYLKVIMDEVFGRKNFVANVIWEKVFASKNSSQYFSTNHDHIFVYAKGAADWKRNLLPRLGSQESDYKNPDNDPRGPWNSVALSARNYYSLGEWSVTTPSGRFIPGPPKGRYWSVSPEKFKKLCADNRIWWGKKGEGVPRRKVFLSEVQEGIVPPTIWPHGDAGNTQEAKKEVLAVVPTDVEVFATPKPEKLLRRILTVATNHGDLVLDSFLGSGTTTAVAHKMGRRYIGIEMGDHAVTHCAPRLRKVIDGDHGGISEAMNWQGGGGFRFYRLGEPVFDAAGRVAPGIRFAPLAAHLWFVETGFPFSGRADSALIGSHEGTAYYLLYNGVLGDKRPHGGNVLTSKILAALPPFDGPKVIFGEACRLGAERLTREGITFRQIPYEIKAR